MARRDDTTPLVLAIYGASILILLPFIIVTIIEYILLHRKLIYGREVIRIIDFWRAVIRLKYGLAAMTCVAAAAYIVLTIASKDSNNTNSGIYLIILFLIAITIAFRTGVAFAVGLIGVVLDKGNGTIAFPTDGILRSFTSFRVVMDSVIPASMEMLPVSSIRSLNRQAGKTLLIHGDFGSRAITFSDKLRRDQLLSCLSGYRRYNDLEFAGPGDYA